MSASHPLPKSSVPNAELEPWVLQVLEAHRGHALRTPDVFRAVDAQLVESGETRYTGSQQLRVVLQGLVEAHQASRRLSDDRDDPATQRDGHPVLLWSADDEVPPFRVEYAHASLNHLPGARVNPEHRRTGRRSRTKPSGAPMGVPVRELSEVPKAELIISLIRELARDAESAPDERELDKLRQENVRLKEERDSAVKQLKAIARAQRTIQDVLGDR